MKIFVLTRSTVIDHKWIPPWHVFKFVFFTLIECKFCQLISLTFITQWLGSRQRFFKSETRHWQIFLKNGNVLVMSNIMTIFETKFYHITCVQTKHNLPKIVFCLNTCYMIKSAVITSGIAFCLHSYRWFVLYIVILRTNEVTNAVTRM